MIISLSIAVVGNIGALGVTGSAASIDSLGGLSVGNNSGMESLLCSCNVLSLA